jgi:hypothetical protein
MNERKYYTPEEKMKIVREGLSGTNIRGTGTIGIHNFLIPDIVLGT